MELALTGDGSQMQFFQVIVTITCTVFFIWLTYSDAVFVSPRGNLKRGVVIQREYLTHEHWWFLYNLPDSIIDGRDFILKEGNQVLVRKRPGVRQVPAVEVALFDINPARSVIEYRISWLNFAMLVLSCMTVIMLPVILFSLTQSHCRYSRVIKAYILSKAEESKQV